VHACDRDGAGGGTEYEALAGPLFTVIYVFAGVPVGMWADKANRRNILLIALLTWSIATALMGAATAYWHLVLLRALQGLGEAGSLDTHID